MSRKTIEIRIKRLRTKDRNSVPEIIERWASREGMTSSTAVIHLIFTHPKIEEFMAESGPEMAEQ